MELLLEKDSLCASKVKNSFNFLGNINKGYFYKRGSKDLIYKLSSEIMQDRSLHWIGVIKTKTGKTVKWPHYFRAKTSSFVALFYAESDNLLKKD